jgi:hypothetical protein
MAIKFLLKLALPILLLAGCTFLMGPDEPVGENAGTGTLTVSFGEAGGDRAISSGKDLPAEILAALRYEVRFTGPGNNVINRTVSGGGTISLTLIQGLWRIDASAYYGEDLMGTGSLSFNLIYENTSVRVPMYMSGPLYEITIAPTAGGTVASNFSLAFPGTAVALTITPASGGAVLKPNTLAVNGGGSPTALAGSGAAYTFTMPAADVTVAAEFYYSWRYVRETAAGTGDGSSWANASDDLQKMVDEAAVTETAQGLEALVRVAAGTYKPRYKPNSDGTTDYATPANDRDSTFFLRQGVEVRGGYPAAGGDDASRNPAANVTILSGDLNNSGTRDNGDAYHVVLGVNIPANSGTILDGFTITSGNASVNSTWTVAGTQIKRGYGGGMSNYNSSPDLTRLTISGNGCEFFGGGMYNIGNSNLVLTNATVSGNTARSNSGGGISNENSNPVLTNVTISGNRANGSPSAGGGGMYNNSSSPALTNVTIAGNTASMGGAIYNYNSSSPQIRNSVIWGNTASSSSPGIYGSPTVAYSIVQDSAGGSNGNLPDPGTGSANSPFVSSGWQDPGIVTMPNSAGNYRLGSTSPAIDAGDPSYNPTGAAALDLDGTARIKGGRVDMGAYEF